MTALLSKVQDAIVALATAKVDAKTARDHAGANGSPTATLSTLALLAFHTQQDKAIVETVKTRDDWSKVKSVWSAAVSLAKYLKDGNTIPQGARKEPFTVNGQAVKTLTAEHVAALAAPVAGDTTIPAILKHSKTVKSDRAKTAAAAGALTADTIAAFLRTANGKAEFEGETPDTMLPRMMLDIALYTRVMVQGAAALETEKAAAAVTAASADAETFALQVMEFIDTCGPNVLAEIVKAVDARMAPVAEQAAA